MTDTNKIVEIKNHTKDHLDAVAETLRKKSDTKLLNLQHEGESSVRFSITKEIQKLFS